MLEIGAIVEAMIMRVEPFGIFLAYGNDSIFVPLNNVAWIPTPTMLANLSVGQTLRVMIERLNYEKNTYTGSLKHLDPEGNPYRALSRNPPGTVLRGKVKMVHQNGVTVDVGNDCVGELPLNDQTRHLPEGSEIEVQIASLEVNDQAMTLKLAK